jgi:hypothetical protein
MMEQAFITWQNAFEERSAMPDLGHFAVNLVYVQKSLFNISSLSNILKIRESGYFTLSMAQLAS